MTDDIHKAELAIEASESSLIEAAAHIERAAEKNDDPAVAKELHGAAIAADTTAVRVGWLRATLARLFRRHPPNRRVPTREDIASQGFPEPACFDAQNHCAATSIDVARAALAFTSPPIG